MEKSLIKDANYENRKEIVVDMQHQIYEEFISLKLMNGTNIFDNIYLPRLKSAGVNFLNLRIGGDHNPQAINSYSDFHFWEACKNIDFFLSEESDENSFIICRNSSDIEKAISSQKIGIFLTLAGGRPLEGKPNLNLLSSLRVLYKLGLRGLQITGNGRNRLADGAAQAITGGGLSNFGLEVVNECEKLGIVIDTAQLSDYGFYDIIENTSMPIIDSHSCCKTLSDHPRNLSDDRIRLIGERKGVIGISAWTALVDYKKEQASIDDFIKHIDHVASIAGIESVGLGPDYCGFFCPSDRNVIKGYGRLNTIYDQYNFLTPTQSEKRPGYVQGIHYGIRESDFIEDAGEFTDFTKLTEAVIKNFGENDSRKILGENFLNVYRKILK